MMDQHIEENIAKILEAVCNHRNPALGQFINRVTMTSIPSKIFIPINVDKYLPAPTEEELEKVSSFCLTSRV